MRPTMPGRMYVVVGRFEQPEVRGYRAASMPDAPIRRTAEEAEADERRWMKGDC